MVILDLSEEKDAQHLLLFRLDFVLSFTLWMLVITLSDPQGTLLKYISSVKE